MPGYQSFSCQLLQKCTLMRLVKKLLEAVKPHYLYMGQKDYQQVAVVRQLIKDFQLHVELVMCPIVSEPDGLALSSRNIRLTPEARETSLSLSKSLHTIEAGIGTKPLTELMADATTQLNANAGIHLEYLDIADAETLEPVTDNMSKPMVVLLAATVGGVHLLDNVVV